MDTVTSSFNESDYLDFLIKFFKTKIKNKSAFSADIINKFIFSKIEGNLMTQQKMAKNARF